jgi:prolyl-tRNA synthetase
MRSIDEVSTFLGVDPAHLIKTLIFETDREFVAVLIRGDLEVNEVKLKNELGCTHLQLASEEKIEEITGAPQGFSGPIGLTGVRILADPTVMNLETAATGANSADNHLVGVVPGRDFEAASTADIRLAAPGDPCPKCGKAMIEKRGIEVGHIFKLGTKYSKSMNCSFQDAEGDEHPMIMGCYGLGIGRTVAAAIEQNHDKDGIIWPLPLAPFDVLLIALNPQVDAVRDEAERIYGELQGRGVDVLYDDRPERPGVKFKDADLVGVPIRLVIGQRGLENGEVELSHRRDREKTLVPTADAVAKVLERLEE